MESLNNDARPLPHHVLVRTNGLALSSREVILSLRCNTRRLSPKSAIISGWFFTPAEHAQPSVYGIDSLMGRVGLFLILLLASCSCCFGQDLSDAPSHKFFDKQNLVLFAATGTAIGLDGWSTQR